MPTKKAAGASKVTKAAKQATKAASHTVAKTTKKAAKKVAAGTPSPENERSMADAAQATVRDPPLDTAVTPACAQEGDVLTTATGTPVDNTDNSVKVGPRGSTLLMDHHLREKIMHFDHERIPERVVHARGAGAHGRF